MTLTPSLDFKRLKVVPRLPSATRMQSISAVLPTALGGGAKVGSDSYEQCDTAISPASAFERSRLYDPLELCQELAVVLG